jgi:uncharacterized protein (DUF488 family)
MGNITETTIWTIGHSTRSLEEFVELLQESQIGLLADVRRFPGSRKYPQFNEGALAASLPEFGIDYRLLSDLGGRRQPRSDSPNTAWRNASFRGYADYMETAPFQAAADELLRLAQARRTAIMCSEAVWWRCHRALISDYLKVRGVTVVHILGRGKVEPHPYSSAATISAGRLSYAAASESERDQQGKLF